MSLVITGSKLPLFKQCLFIGEICEAFLLPSSVNCPLRNERSRSALHFDVCRPTDVRVVKVPPEYKYPVFVSSLIVGSGIFLFFLSLLESWGSVADACRSLSFVFCS